MFLSKITRKLSPFGVALAVFGLVAGGPPAGAQDYPTKDVRVIVPFAAGGGTDLVTRLFAQKLGEKHRKAFFVENRAGGGGGSVGSLSLSRSNPDGYTVGAGTSSGIQAAAINPEEYNPLRDLDPVARFGGGTIVVAVNPNVPAKTIAELVAHAKTHPGMAYGSSGIGSANHITGEMLAREASINLKHIPYRGEGAGLTDLVAGQIQFMFISLSAVKSHIQAGTVRAVAVTSAGRSPELPDVPTMVEAGYKDFVVDAWYGLYVPKRTPSKIVDALSKSINEIRADPEVSKRLMQQLGFDTSGTDSPEAFRRFMEGELERYTAVAKAAGLRKN